MGAREKEFEALLRRHARLMASAVRRVCGRRWASLVPDVEQEIRVALWRRLDDGASLRHPTTYIYKTALRTALAEIRKARRHDAEAPPEEAAHDNATADPRPDEAQRALLLEQMLERLDREHRRAVRAHLAGFNHREVAELYGWSESVARHRIYRGIERLKETMKGDAEGGQG